jgi:hypothetical protein
MSQIAGTRPEARFAQLILVHGVATLVLWLLSTSAR